MTANGKHLKIGERHFKFTFDVDGHDLCLRYANLVDIKRGGWYRYRNLQTGKEWSDRLWPTSVEDALVDFILKIRRGVSPIQSHERRAYWRGMMHAAITMFMEYELEDGSLKSA